METSKTTEMCKHYTTTGHPSFNPWCTYLDIRVSLACHSINAKCPYYVPSTTRADDERDKVVFAIAEEKAYNEIEQEIEKAEKEITRLLDKGIKIDEVIRLTNIQEQHAS